MKKLLPDLRRVPVRFSLTVIALSPIAFYLLMIRPVNADPGEWLRNTINQAASDTGITPKAVPVPSQPAPIGNSQYSDCVPPAPPQVSQVEQAAPVVRATKTYWDGQGKVLSDQRAIALLNMAQGTTRKSVYQRLGMGTNLNGSTIYNTEDGNIQVNYRYGDRLLSDRIEWVGFVQ